MSGFGYIVGTMINKTNEKEKTRKITPLNHFLIYFFCARVF